MALDNGLTPISCVGETLAEREVGRTMEVVGRQVDAILEKPPPPARELLSVAEEGDGWGVPAQSEPA